MPLARLEALLGPERAQRLEREGQRAREVLDGRVLWNVNSTAQGGGVAEMLQSLLAYARAAGIETRWLTLTADAEFFAITKRLHNLLHGVAGDGGDLGTPEREHLKEVLAANFDVLRTLVRPQDLVLLHDPQTAGLVEAVSALGAKVIWRCHIGRDTGNEHTERAWQFLRPVLEPADAFVFSRHEYPPPWIPREKTRVIPPSLDPFTAKNVELDQTTTGATLRLAGLVQAEMGTDHPSFPRRDGSHGVVREHRGLLLDGGEVPGTAQLVLQVSRWDRLKDPVGVLRGFAENLDQLPDTAHLMLAGPDVTGVADDPEGAEVLTECMSTWQALPSAARSRLHLALLPMDDVDENAHLVNALQRHADVVVQKSLVEGFGLTVPEPMWKSKPVVASAVGGIQDQIDSGVNGILLADPGDLDVFADHVRKLLVDDETAARLGTAARARVEERFLGDRHLMQYVDLFASLLA